MRRWWGPKQNKKIPHNLGYNDVSFITYMAFSSAQWLLCINSGSTPPHPHHPSDPSPNPSPLPKILSRKKRGALRAHLRFSLVRAVLFPRHLATQAFSQRLITFSTLTQKQGHKWMVSVCGGGRIYSCLIIFHLRIMQFYETRLKSY